MMELMRIFNFLLCIITLVNCDISGSFDTVESNWCPSLLLQHGKIRLRSKGHIARFTCVKPYVLVGANVATCVNGSWDVAIPFCAKNACGKLDKLLNGELVPSYRGAVMKPVCDHGFTLVGSPLLYCEENSWNDTLPSCLAESIHQFDVCHFEPGDSSLQPQYDQCDWTNKGAIFNWRILSPEFNSDQSVPNAYPNFDRTLAPHPTGHYIYLDSRYPASISNLQLLRRSGESAAASLISPLFRATSYRANGTETNATCLVFWLYMYGPHAGTIRVNVENDTIWEVSGSRGNFWKKVVLPINHLDSPFRVILLGFGELGYHSNTAIDEIQMTSGSKCDYSTHDQILNYPVEEEIKNTTAANVTEINKDLENSQNETKIEKSPKSDTILSQGDNSTVENESTEIYAENESVVSLNGIRNCSTEITDRENKTNERDAICHNLKLPEASNIPRTLSDNLNANERNDKNHTLNQTNQTTQTKESNRETAIQPFVKNVYRDQTDQINRTQEDQILNEGNQTPIEGIIRDNLENHAETTLTNNKEIGRILRKEEADEKEIVEKLNEDNIEKNISLITGKYNDTKKYINSSKIVTGDVTRSSKTQITNSENAKTEFSVDSNNQTNQFERSQLELKDINQKGTNQTRDRELSQKEKIQKGQSDQITNQALNIYSNATNTPVSVIPSEISSNESNQNGTQIKNVTLIQRLHTLHHSINRIMKILDASNNTNSNFTFDESNPPNRKFNSSNNSSLLDHMVQYNTHLARLTPEERGNHTQMIHVIHHVVTGLKNRTLERASLQNSTESSLKNKFPSAKPNQTGGKRIIEPHYDSQTIKNENPISNDSNAATPKSKIIAKMKLLNFTDILTKSKSSNNNYADYSPSERTTKLNGSFVLSKNDNGRLFYNKNYPLANTSRNAFENQTQLDYNEIPNPSSVANAIKTSTSRIRANSKSKIWNDVEHSSKINKQLSDEDMKANYLNANSNYPKNRIVTTERVIVLMSPEEYEASVSEVKPVNKMMIESYTKKKSSVLNAVVIWILCPLAATIVVAVLWNNIMKVQRESAERVHFISHDESMELSYSQPHDEEDHDISIPNSKALGNTNYVPSWRQH